MSRENGTTTKWKTLQNEEDDDDQVLNHGTEAMEPLDGVDDYEQMQEGRRVLGLAMAPPNKHADSILSPGALGRVICTSILACFVCMLLGALIGYLAAVKTHPAMSCPSKDNVVPASLPPTIDCSSTPVPKPTTTTTTTTTIKPVLSTEPPEIIEPVEDIASMASHFLSHLSPRLIRMYINNITSVPADNVKRVILSTLESLGFTVQPLAIKSMMSFPETTKPNKVEIIFNDNGTKMVNLGTHSLTGLSPYSAWSPNGTVEGNLVYAHYARPEDLDILKANQINLTNSILLVRNGHLHPGVQVRNVEKTGAIGVIFYPEPEDFRGNSPEAVVYPDGIALPRDGIVMKNLRFIPGDPSTPNIPSNKYSYRLPQSEYSGIPSILVQPVSAETGKTLLALLGGNEVPPAWKGSLADKYYFGGEFLKEENVSSIRMIINNFIAEETTTVTLASLPSKGETTVVHIGCRYESKGDNLTSSGLGLATLLALADAYKSTFSNGTRRKVVFSMYEGLDGDFSGGNEFAQMFSAWLESTAMAYLDLDTVLAGSGFVEANVSPLLRGSVREAFQHVAWPVGEGLNVMQGVLKAYGDSSNVGNENQAGDVNSFKFSNPYECDEAVNFHTMHGIPTVQLTSVSINKKNSFTLQDSQYDSIDSVIKLEDKDLQWTHMIASVMGVVSLILSQVPIPSIRFDEIGYDMQAGWNVFIADSRTTFNTSEPRIHEILSAIDEEMDKFVVTMNNQYAWYKEGTKLVRKGSSIFELDHRVMSILQLPRRFLRPRGAASSDSFGYLLSYGPDPEKICEGTYFPFLRKAILDMKNNVTTSFDRLHEELLYLYVALYSINLEIFDNTTIL